MERPFSEGFRTMESKDSPGSWLRVSHIPEESFTARALIGEWKRLLVEWYVVLKPIQVLRGLFCDTTQGGSFWLRLNDTDSFSVHEKDIVGFFSVLQREIGNCDPERGPEIDFLIGLDSPA